MNGYEKFMTWHSNDHSTRPELILLINELMAMAVSLNRNNFSIFISYSGHVAVFNIRYYATGHDSNKQTGEWNFYLNDDQVAVRIREAIHHIEWDFRRLIGPLPRAYGVIPELQNSAPVARKKHKKQNLSDAERQRRREHMRNYWAKKRAAAGQVLAATAE